MNFTKKVVVLYSTRRKINASPIIHMHYEYFFCSYIKEKIDIKALHVSQKNWGILQIMHFCKWHAGTHGHQNCIPYLFK